MGQFGVTVLSASASEFSGTNSLLALRSPAAIEGQILLLLGEGSSHLYDYAFSDPLTRIDPRGELAFVPALAVILAGATAIGVGVPVAISKASGAMGLTSPDKHSQVQQTAKFVAQLNTAIFTGVSLGAGAVAACESAAAGFANPVLNNQAAAFFSGFAGGPSPGVAGTMGKLTRKAIQFLQ